MDAMNTFNIFADYNQFFLLDDGAQPAFPEIIPQLAIDQRFQIAPNLVAVYTAATTDVSVSVSISESEPMLNLEAWSYVVRCPIAAPSGRLALAGCTDYLPNCPRIEVPIGNCGLLVCGRGFGEGEREEYLLQIWPGIIQSPTVLKNYVVNHG